MRGSRAVGVMCAYDMESGSVQDVSISSLEWAFRVIN